MFERVALNQDHKDLPSGREGIIVAVRPGGASVSVEFAQEGDQKRVRADLPLATLTFLQLEEPHQKPAQTTDNTLFVRMCWISIFVASALVFTLFLAPNVIFWLFDVEPHPTGSFMGRRAAMFFAGIGVLAFLAAPTRSAEIRTTIGLSISTAMFGLAVLGIFELLFGSAGPGILLAVCAELGICIGFLMALREVEGHI